MTFNIYCICTLDGCIYIVGVDKTQIKIIVYKLWTGRELGLEPGIWNWVRRMDLGLEPEPGSGPGSGARIWTWVRSLDLDLGSEPVSGPGSEVWTCVRSLDLDPGLEPGSGPGSGAWIWNMVWSLDRTWVRSLNLDLVLNRNLDLFGAGILAWVWSCKVRVRM